MSSGPFAALATHSTLISRNNHWRLTYCGHASFRSVVALDRQLPYPVEKQVFTLGRRVVNAVRSIIMDRLMKGPDGCLRPDGNLQ